MSSLHCRIRVGTETLGKSARLSDRKVTRANALAISGSVRQKPLVSSSPSSGAVQIAHDGRRHRCGPAHVVVLQKLWALVDLLLAEAADISDVVDVACRRADGTRRPNMPGAFRRPARRSWH
jgi:hypothetical protein